MRLITLGSGLLMVMAGCATTGPTDETGARLPDGVTLLESTQDRCSGVVHVNEGPRDAGEIVLRPGQNASFRVADERIEWVCIGDDSTSDDNLNCPDETSHVRITRPSAGEQFLVECYGRT
jgi:hypothetical protein